MTQLILGLTGPLGSGKGTVIDMLAKLAQERGFAVVRLSLSDMLRAELRQRGIPLERPNLKRVGDELRAERGPGALAALTIPEIDREMAALPGIRTLLLVDGIRNPGEVRTLRDRYGQQFRLVGINAAPEKILNHLQARRREDEPAHVLADSEQLRSVIAAEMGGSASSEFSHNVAACLAMADWPPLMNDGALDDLENAVRALAASVIFPMVQE